MLDGVSLDQLRTFVAAADEGSFSAAGRKLSRTQSAVSELIGNLEAQVGIVLFDRSARYPQLTTEGAMLLGDARSILAGVNTLKSRAKGMAAGLEPELSLILDVFYPFATFTAVAKEFSLKFPNVPLRLYVEALGAACQPVLDKRCSLGIIGTLPNLPSSVTAERLTDVAYVMVAAQGHPLAAVKGIVPKAELAKHLQLVLTDRSQLTAGRELGVMATSTWRLADIFAKHAFLLNGLGWGGMPLHIVRKDLAEGRLVMLSVDEFPPGGALMPMSAIYLNDAPPGPAGRWLIERMKLVDTLGKAG